MHDLRGCCCAGRLALMDEHNLHIRNAARRSGTVVVACGHVALLILTLTRSIDFTADPKWAWLRDSASSPTIWVPIHAVLALSLAWGLLRHSDAHIRNTLSFSAGFIIMWATLAMVWGLNASRDVSLAGPVLGFVAGAGAWTLSRAYVSVRTSGKG